jgi:hypothetical protein
MQTKSYWLGRIAKVVGCQHVQLKQDREAELRNLTEFLLNHVELCFP